MIYASKNQNQKGTQFFFDSLLLLVYTNIWIYKVCNELLSTRKVYLYFHYIPRSGLGAHQLEKKGKVKERKEEKKRE